MAWKYRFPTFILGDGYQAKMRESLTIYDPELKGIQMVPTEPIVGMAGMPGVDRDPAHLRNTYNTEEELYRVVKGYQAEYDKITPEIVEHEEEHCEDADLVIISHGVVSRSVKMAVRELRQEGLKVGYFRPITVRPFPKEGLTQAVKNAKRLFVVESAEGQLARQVKENLYGTPLPMDYLFKPGVGVTVEEVLVQARTLIEG